MSRYADFLHADTGLTFAEYLGINVPREDSMYGRDGKFLYRYSRMDFFNDSIYGEWKPTKKEAKASYKAALKSAKQEKP